MYNTKYMHINSLAEQGSRMGRNNRAQTRLGSMLDPVACLTCSRSGHTPVKPFGAVLVLFFCVLLKVDNSYLLVLDLRCYERKISKKLTLMASRTAMK